MKKVRIGLIGLGFMGSTHFRIYRSLPNAEIVALADIDAVKRTGNISSVNGNIGNYDNSVPLDLTGVKVYDNGMDLISDPNVDVVDVCVPTPWHKDYMIAALKAGKNLFSEKPFCRNAAEAEEIIAAAKTAKGFFNVGMCVRAWPEYRNFHERFVKGEFGKVIVADFRRLSRDVRYSGAWNQWYTDAVYSGGALLDLHLHDTDFITSTFGCPKAVRSEGRSICCKNNGIDHIVTSYDYGANGPLITAVGGWSSAEKVPFEMSFQVICEKATVRNMAEGYKIYWTDGRVETPELNIGDKPTGWHQELAYFVDCVASGVKPDRYQTLESIAESFRVIMAEESSVKTGKQVNL